MTDGISQKLEQGWVLSSQSHSQRRSLKIINYLNWVPSFSKVVNSGCYLLSTCSWSKF